MNISELKEFSSIKYKQQVKNYEYFSIKGMFAYINKRERYGIFIGYEDNVPQRKLIQLYIRFVNTDREFRVDSSGIRYLNIKRIEPTRIPAEISSGLKKVAKEVYKTEQLRLKVEEAKDELRKQNQKVNQDFSKVTNDVYVENQLENKKMSIEEEFITVVNANKQLFKWNTIDYALRSHLCPKGMIVDREYDGAVQITETDAYTEAKGYEFLAKHYPSEYRATQAIKNAKYKTFKVESMLEYYADRHNDESLNVAFSYRLVLNKTKDGKILNEELTKFKQLLATSRW